MSEKKVVEVHLYLHLQPEKTIKAIINLLRSPEYRQFWQEVWNSLFPKPQIPLRQGSFLYEGKEYRFIQSPVRNEIAIAPAPEGIPSYEEAKALANTLKHTIFEGCQPKLIQIIHHMPEEGEETFSLRIAHPEKETLDRICQKLDGISLFKEAKP